MYNKTKTCYNHLMLELTERQWAYVDLLRLPDDPKLLDLSGFRRGHKITCPGDENRRITWRADLLTRWSVRRDLEVDLEQELQPATKITPWEAARLSRERRRGAEHKSERAVG